MTANVTIMPKNAGWNESPRAELHVVHDQPVMPNIEVNKMNILHGVTCGGKTYH
jgi:hypothetical protein